MQLVSEISSLCDHKSPTSQTDRQTDGRTDRRTTCDPKTAHMHLSALCGKNVLDPPMATNVVLALVVVLILRVVVNRFAIC